MFFVLLPKGDEEDEEKEEETNWMERKEDKQEDMWRKIMRM